MVDTDRWLNYSDISTSSARLGIILGTSVLVTSTAAVLGSFVLGDAVLVRPAVGLAFVVGVCFGPVGALGAAVGSLAGALVTGALGPIDLFVAAAYFWMAYLPYEALDRYRANRGSAPSWLDSPRTGLALAGTALVGAAAGASTVLWGHVILGSMPFYVAPRLMVSYVSSALVVGLPVLLLAENWGWNLAPRLRRSVPPRTGSLLAVTAPPIAWITLGTVGSLGYRSFERLQARYPHALADRGLEFVTVLHNGFLFGPGGARIQIVLGSIMTSLMGLSTLSAIGVDWRRFGKNEGVDEA